MVAGERGRPAGQSNRNLRTPSELESPVTGGTKVVRILTNPRGSWSRYRGSARLPRLGISLVATAGALALGLAAIGPVSARTAQVANTTATTGGSYVSVTPTRIADTRANSGKAYAGDTLATGGTLQVQVPTSVVPAGATGVVLNVTAIDPSAAGFISVLPGGATVPTGSSLVSNLNFAAGATVANLVTVGLSSTGTVEIFNHVGSTNVAVDVEGYYTSTAASNGSGLYNALSPTRVLGTLQSGLPIPADSFVQVPVAGSSAADGVPSNATAVVVNVTAAGATAPSFLTVFPFSTTSGPPTASNLNFGAQAANQAIANRVTVGVGSSGSIGVYNHAGTVNVDVDVSGYYTGSGGTGSTFVAITPQRLTDTRSATNGTPIAANTSESFSLTNSAIPADAAAVAANFTVVPGNAPGYATVYPTADTTPPVASDVNWTASESPAVPNYTIADTAGTGSVAVFNSHGATINLLIDAFGYFTPFAAPVTAAYTMSTPAFTGQTIGTGTATSPAVAYTATATSLTASSTLTSASGASVAGVNTTLDVFGGTQPTVTNNGITESATTITGGWSYTIPTDSAGTATAKLTVAANTSESYTVAFQAPFNQANGKPVNSGNGYAEFVASSAIGISPFGSSSSPYISPVSTLSNETAGLVTVTATLPPLNGGAQSNVAVTFSTSGTAFFANAQGTLVASGTFKAYTDSSGQATAYVNNNSAEGADGVTATAGSASTETWLAWGQPGVPQSVINRGVSNTTSGTPSTGVGATTGTNVTLSGTIVDATGTAVPSATLLITSVSGQGGYVTGSGSSATTTAFPNAEPTSGTTITSTGAPYGTTVTTNSSGAFSLTVTDSNSETDVYQVWYVQNGIVQSSSPLGTKSGPVDFSVAYSVSTATVTAVGVAAGNNLSTAVADNGGTPPSTLSGVSYQVTMENGSGNITNTPGQIEIGAFNGAGSDYLAANTSSSVTYQVSANKSGFISSVDGVLLDGSTSGLPNKASAITITVTDNAGTSAVKVNGVAIPTGSGSGYTAPTDGAGNPSFVNVGVSDQTAETDTFTAAVGTISAKATVGFTAGPVAGLSASPSVASPTSGTAQTITFTATDANGNPVAGAPVTISEPGVAQGLWLTGVDGKALTQDIGPSSASEPTPIPLYAPSTAPGYNSLSVAGEVSWNGGPSVTFTTNSKGTFSVTIQNANVPYWTGSSSSGSVLTSGSTFSSTIWVTNSFPFEVLNQNPGGSYTAATVIYGSTPALTTPAMVSAVVTSGTGTNANIVVTYNESVSCASAAGSDFTYFNATGGAATSAFTCAPTASKTLTLTGTGTTNLYPALGAGGYLSYSPPASGDSTTASVYAGSGSTTAFAANQTLDYGTSSTPPDSLS